MRTIVWGPPCSGKSTYVKDNAKSGDGICDYDAIYQALSGLGSKKRVETLNSFVLDVIDCVHDEIEKHEEIDAWIITATKDLGKRDRLVERFSAELVVLEVTREEAHRRCDEDGRPEEWHQYIDDWFDEVEGVDEEKSNTENRNKRPFMGMNKRLNFQEVKENSLESRQTLAFDAVGGGEMEIYCYGDIMDSYWFFDPAHPPLGYVTQDSMKEALDQAAGKPVLFRIHSSGGDMMVASAIRSMLMSYPGKVTCQIDGLCASAATYIATAGAKVQMQDSAFFMIHDPWTVTIGDIADHRVTISALKELKKGIVESYMAKCALEQSQIEKMMADTTWMSAQTALNYGFVDEIISQPASARAAAIAKDSLPVMNQALKGYSEVPQAVQEMMQKGLNVTEEPATSVLEEASDTEPDQGNNRERAVQALRDKIENLKKEKVNDRIQECI